ncbi:MAG: hypothetical protein PF448_14250 [Bacteroidales bacterium]|jgi:hypothetical protein|nr:hypothetical protein [Bacteroidales bacterium]
MKNLSYLFLGLFVMFSACQSPKDKPEEKSSEKQEQQEQGITKQFYVSYEIAGETVIMQSDDASCGYAYTNSIAMYNVDMSYEYDKTDDILKQMNFGFYIADKEMINAEGLVGNQFPVRLNIFHRDLSKAPSEQFVYQMSTDFARDAEQVCTFDSYEQIGDSRYYLASGTFSCTLSNMEETEQLKIENGKFAMKVKP